MFLKAKGSRYRQSLLLQAVSVFYAWTAVSFVKGTWKIQPKLQGIVLIADKTCDLKAFPLVWTGQRLQRARNNSRNRKRDTGI